MKDGKNAKIRPNSDLMDQRLQNQKNIPLNELNFIKTILEQNKEHFMQFTYEQSRVTNTNDDNTLTHSMEENNTTQGDLNTT